jgi:hypothetical protein
VLSFLVLYTYLIVKHLKNVHSGLTEKNVRQIHRKPGGESCGSCQIDEPAREGAKLITTGRKKEALLLENCFTTICHVHERKESKGALVDKRKDEN